MTIIAGQSTIGDFLNNLGDPVADSDEETFALFSQDIESQNLGFVDSELTDLEVEVGSKTFSVTQSPGLLNSNRATGTTGAFLWRITPYLASWLTSSNNVLRQSQLLNSDSTIVELGCGTSGLIGLTLAPEVGKYILTDQAYVSKLVQANLQANSSVVSSLQNLRQKGKAASSEGAVFSTLDWETDSVQSLSQVLGSRYHKIDFLIACDCIYNEHLISPFMETCSDICSLASEVEDETEKVTILLVAQQLRSPDVFQTWLDECLKRFDVWRLPDHLLTENLKQGSGNVLHLGILRQQPREF
ncbi:MAG: hypothetical protein Q9160_004338 [Pyrenula sp. 1 TL-2023]